MSSIGGLHCGLGTIKNGSSWGSDTRNEAKTSNQKARFTRKGFFLVRIPPNKDRSFSRGLDWSGHLGLCDNRNFCSGLVQGLNGGSSEDLGLDGGNDSSGGGGMRDIKKADEKILCLCDSLIKVFGATFNLFNHVFLGL